MLCSALLLTPSSAIPVMFSPTKRCVHFFGSFSTCGHCESFPFTDIYPTPHFSYNRKKLSRAEIHTTCLAVKLGNIQVPTKRCWLANHSLTDTYLNKIILDLNSARQESILLKRFVKYLYKRPGWNLTINKAHRHSTKAWWR